MAFDLDLNDLSRWLRRASELRGLWPCIACGVCCHGDHPHHVCLIRACRTTGLSRTVCLIHWWAPVSCVSCHNCVSRWRLILTWTIRPPPPPETVRSVRGRPVLQWTDYSWTGVRSDLNSQGDGSPGLVSELVARRLVRGRLVSIGNGSLTVASSQVLRACSELNCRR